MKNLFKKFQGWSTPKKAIGALALTAAVVIGATTAAPERVSAQGLHPFGGFVSAVVYCDCVGTWLIYIDDLVQNDTPDYTLMYVPGMTIVYEYFMIPVPGVWLLGLHTDIYLPCLVGMPFCFSIGTGPEIYMVGTSL